MKKTPAHRKLNRNTDDLQPEYRFDYRKAKPNRFVARMKNEPLIVLIEPDIAKVFTSSEQVNKALRALSSAIPEKKAVVGK